MPPRNLVLATDLSCRSDRALDRARALATEWNARLTIVHAFEAPPPVSELPSWRRPLDPRDLATRQIHEDLRDSSALAYDLVIERAEPARLVLDTATRVGADLIVTGIPRDETLRSAVVGTTVEAITRGAQVPVLAARTRPRGRYRNVAVATDFAEPSRQALVTAVELFPDARVRLFHAFQVFYEGFITDKDAAREDVAVRAEADARAFLAATELPSARRIEIQCEYGPPDEVLADLVLSGGVNLVVAGTRGAGRVSTLLLGSVAQALLTRLPGDVMVVPRTE